MRLAAFFAFALVAAVCLAPTLACASPDETRVVIGGGQADVVTLTDANFDSEVQPETGAQADYFVEFYAPWCGHCKSLAPTWKALAASLASVSDPRPIRVGQLDSTVEVGQTKRFGIKGFPSLKLFSQGKVYDYKGARTLEALEAFAKARGEGLTAGSIPEKPSTIEMALEHFLSWSGDVQQILARKPVVGGIFFAVGLMVGILASVIVFATCVEKLPAEYVRYTDPATGQVMTVPYTPASPVPTNRNQQPTQPAQAPQQATAAKEAEDDVPSSPEPEKPVSRANKGSAKKKSQRD